MPLRLVSAIDACSVDRRETYSCYHECGPHVSGERNLLAAAFKRWRYCGSGDLLRTDRESKEHVGGCRPGGCEGIPQSGQSTGKYLLRPTGFACVAATIDAEPLNMKRGTTGRLRLLSRQRSCFTKGHSADNQLRIFEPACAPACLVSQRLSFPV